MLHTELEQQRDEIDKRAGRMQAIAQVGKSGICRKHLAWQLGEHGIVAQVSATSGPSTCGNQLTELFKQTVSRDLGIG